MTVTAYDLGQPTRSSNLSVNVDVVDVNDNTPIFTIPSKINQSYAATIQSEEVIVKIKVRKF